MDLRSSISDLRLHKRHGREPVRLPCVSQSLAQQTHGLTPVALSRSWIGNRKSAIANGFTLTELLVVIGLIVVLISLAVPTFSALRGANSVENAANIVSASLARARAEAVGLQRPFGIAFYRETATTRFAMALVEIKSPISWTANTAYDVGDWVKNGTAPDYYVCHTAHTSGGTFAATNWRTVNNTSRNDINNGTLPIDLVVGSDRLLLPTGIGCAAASDAYYGLGVILFDENGMLTTRTVSLVAESQLGQETTIPVSTTTSQIALMLFSDEDAKTASYSAAWISANGTPLLINRYNGTLVKGE